MLVVFKAKPLGSAGRWREHGNQTIERRYRRLLIYAEDRGKLGRVLGQADDVDDGFLIEIWIVAYQVTTSP